MQTQRRRRLALDRIALGPEGVKNADKINFPGVLAHKLGKLKAKKIGIVTGLKELIKVLDVIIASRGDGGNLSQVTEKDK